MSSVCAGDQSSHRRNPARSRLVAASRVNRVVWRMAAAPERLSAGCAKGDGHDEAWTNVSFVRGKSRSADGDHADRVQRPAGSLRPFQRGAIRGFPRRGVHDLSAARALAPASRSGPSSKTKFTCSGCGQNVRGKPDTAVICEPGGIKMETAA